MDTVTLKISGMTCEHCVRSVQRALAGVAGADVGQVRVGTAVVRYDPQRVTVDRLRTAVADEGYEVTGTG